MINLGYIGAGKISKFHLPALKNNDFIISAIGTKKDSQNCKKFAYEEGIESSFCSGGWEEVIQKKVDAFCVCIDTDFTPNIVEKILDLNKPVLVEKPLAWRLSDLKKILNHKNKHNIFVAYNRRFYEGSK